jgi:predicted enzyme related to lactoylglutathione lyase
MLNLRICIDVPELDRAIEFYTKALGLKLGRRNGPHWAELLGAPCPIDLLPVEAGSAATPASGAAAAQRTYERHWTAVHLDLAVEDLDAAVARAEAAGAKLERAIVERKWGKMANMGDPFGHGFCLLQFKGGGYDELLSPPAT